jgi:hypothetical protein
MAQGIDRKLGAGRKINDNSMEKKLLLWIQKTFREEKTIPQNKVIKKKALSFSNNPNFKASKGWCDKFLKRNKKEIEELIK